MRSARRFASAGIAFAAFAVFFFTPRFPLPAKALVCDRTASAPARRRARPQTRSGPRGGRASRSTSLVALWVARDAASALAARGREFERQSSRSASKSRAGIGERRRPATPARERTPVSRQSPVETTALAQAHARRETDFARSIVRELRVPARRPPRSSEECRDPASPLCCKKPKRERGGPCSRVGVSAHPARPVEAVHEVVHVPKSDHRTAARRECIRPTVIARELLEIVRRSLPPRKPLRWIDAR